MMGDLGWERGLGLVHRDRTVTRLDIPRWTSGVKACMRRRDSIKIFIRFTAHKGHNALLLSEPHKAGIRVHAGEY